MSLFEFIEDRGLVRFHFFVAFTMPKRIWGSLQNTYHLGRLYKLEVGVKDKAKGK